MKAFLITLVILLLVGAGPTWWLMRRGSRANTSSDTTAAGNVAPVSPAGIVTVTQATDTARPEDPAQPGEAPAQADAPAQAGAPAQPEEIPAAVGAAVAGATAATSPAAQTTLEVPAGEFGPTSAAPLADGSAPAQEFTVKVNATSMLYHAPESPYYKRTKAAAWFRTAEDAEAAGFQHWNSRRRNR